MEDNRNLPGYGKMSLTGASRVATLEEMIKEFCSWYDQEEVQGELLDLLLAAINSEEADNWSSAMRGEFIFLYRRLAKLVGALYREKAPHPAAMQPIK